MDKVRGSGGCIAPAQTPKPYATAHPLLVSHNTPRDTHPLRHALAALESGYITDLSAGVSFSRCPGPQALEER